MGFSYFKSREKLSGGGQRLLLMCIFERHNGTNRVLCLFSPGILLSGFKRSPNKKKNLKQNLNS